MSELSWKLGMPLMMDQTTTNFLSGTKPDDFAPGSLSVRGATL